MRYNIPVNFKEGVYGTNSLSAGNGDMLNMELDEDYNILTYNIPGNICPGYEWRSQVDIYSITKDEIDGTLEATYNSNGHLKKIITKNNNKERLLYIYYENIEDAKNEIKEFAEVNADIIIEKICACQDKVSRLFTEKFNDGSCMDFHAKIGTKEQKDIIKAKYHDTYTIDNPGNYPSEMIYGSNETLGVMVLCAYPYREEMNFWVYVTGIMEKHIEEKAVAKLDKADDFEFLATEYD
ncbi:MAG: hypothetical protein HFH68_08290 [Lachnospiraceae bacterium]|nr:hypothetical protein [Lachnospiraceae bacterium]